MNLGSAPLPATATVGGWGSHLGTGGPGDIQRSSEGDTAEPLGALGSKLRPQHPQRPCLGALGGWGRTAGPSGTPVASPRALERPDSPRQVLPARPSPARSRSTESACPCEPPLYVRTAGTVLCILILPKRGPPHPRPPPSAGGRPLLLGPHSLLVSPPQSQSPREAGVVVPRQQHNGCAQPR